MLKRFSIGNTSGSETRSISSIFLGDLQSITTRAQIEKNKHTSKVCNGKFSERLLQISFLWGVEIKLVNSSNVINAVKSDYAWL